MKFSQILLCEFAIGSNCESEAKAKRKRTHFKNCEAKAKRSRVHFVRSSLRFALFRNRANSHCEFGALIWWLNFQKWGTFSQEALWAGTYRAASFPNSSIFNTTKIFAIFFLQFYSQTEIQNPISAVLKFVILKFAMLVTPLFFTEKFVQVEKSNRKDFLFLSF